MKNDIIQAVIKCKKCKKFLNLYYDQTADLMSFNRDEYDDRFYFRGFIINENSPVVKCKCPGAILCYKEIIEELEHSEKYDNYFIRNNDSLYKKINYLVGRFYSKSRKKYYFDFIINADLFQLTKHCYFDGPFQHTLEEIKKLVIKERNVSKISIEESMDEETALKLKELFNKTKK